MGKTAITGKVGDALAQKLREERERARKRAEIQAKINEWNNKLNNVNSQISSLNTQQSNLNTYLADWDTQKNTYNGSDILSDVVIVNVFEGVCADDIKADFSDCITQMDTTYSDVSGLNGNVSLQISRLNEYVTFINGKIAALKSELNSI